MIIIWSYRNTKENFGVPDHPVFLITIYKCLMKTGKLMLWLEELLEIQGFSELGFDLFNTIWGIQIGTVFEQIEVKWGDNNNYIKEN